MTETSYYLAKGQIFFSGNLDEKKTGYQKDTRECYRFSIKNPHFKNKTDFKEIVSHYNLEDRFTPKWVKEWVNSKKPPEYINFKSDYPLITKERTEAGDIDIDRSSIISGAEGWLSISVKYDHENMSCAIYANQFLMLKNGELRNPFEGV